MKIYLAAPLFNEMELHRNLNICLKLENAGFQVYLPQRDGHLLVKLIEFGMSIPEAKGVIFTNDISAILDCDILVIIMDGRTIDEGASFELGFAYANKKQCIGLQTDIRRLLKYGNNPMIDMSLNFTFQNDIDLLNWLKEKYKNNVEEVFHIQNK